MGCEDSGTSKPRENDFVGNTRSPWKLKMMGCFNKESPSEEADFQVFCILNFRGVRSFSSQIVSFKVKSDLYR